MALLSCRRSPARQQRHHAALQTTWRCQPRSDWHQVLVHQSQDRLVADRARTPGFPIDSVRDPTTPTKQPPLLLTTAQREHPLVRRKLTARDASAHLLYRQTPTQLRRPETLLATSDRSREPRTANRSHHAKQSCRTSKL